MLSSATPVAPWQKRLQILAKDLACLSAEAKTLAQRPLREACSACQQMGAMLGTGPDWAAGRSAPDWEPPSLEQPPPSVQCEAWSLQPREPGCNRLPGRNDWAQDGSAQHKAVAWMWPCLFLWANKSRGTSLACVSQAVTRMETWRGAHLRPRAWPWSRPLQPQRAGAVRLQAHLWSPHPGSGCLPPPGGP